MLGDEVDRHIGVKPGEVGLELPETWSFAELVRLFGEEAFLVRNEHARPQPLEGRETMVETISGRPGRIGNVAPAARAHFRAAGRGGGQGGGSTRTNRWSADNKKKKKTNTN